MATRSYFPELVSATIILKAGNGCDAKRAIDRSTYSAALIALSELEAMAGYCSGMNCDPIADESPKFMPSCNRSFPDKIVDLEVLSSNILARPLLSSIWRVSSSMTFGF